jgi:hypothetical protein
MPIPSVDLKAGSTIYIYGIDDVNVHSRVSSETSFVSYFAKHETKQTCCFVKFRLEAKQAVLHVSLFF